MIGMIQNEHSYEIKSIIINFINIKQSHEIQSNNKTHEEKQTCNIEDLKIKTFGSENDNYSYPQQIILARSVKVNSPNDPSAGGIRYTSNDPNAIYDIEVFTDGSFHLADQSNAQCKIALLWEPPSISDAMYQEFLNGHVDQKFNKVFTFHKGLLEKNPDKFKRYLPADAWVRSRILLQDEDYYFNQSIQCKTEEMVSMILSDKKSANGHKIRHLAWQFITLQHILQVKGCGNGAGNHVNNKTECLDSFRFSIIIEEDKDQGYYFSEKLIDCLLVGTVPILWGTADNLKNIFDVENGFIMWNTLEDLKEILTVRLGTPEKMKSEYERRLNAIYCNYKRSLQFTIPLFDRLVNHIVESDDTVNCNVCCSLYGDKYTQ